MNAIDFQENPNCIKAFLVEKLQIREIDMKLQDIYRIVLPICLHNLLNFHVPN